MHEAEVKRILFFILFIIYSCLPQCCWLFVTGVFTAPIRGIYHFVVFAYGLGHESTGTGVSLHKNREHVTVAWGRQPSQTVTPSTGASLLLAIGDVVYVKLWPYSWLHNNGYLPNTFSGHLLFTVWGTSMSLQPLSAVIIFSCVHYSFSKQDQCQINTEEFLSFGSPFIFLLLEFCLH